jgi:hypothetical protein
VFDCDFRGEPMDRIASDSPGISPRIVDVVVIAVVVVVGLVGVVAVDFFTDH